MEGEKVSPDSLFSVGEPVDRGHRRSLATLAPP
jgi:hypothetical protein